MGVSNLPFNSSSAYALLREARCGRALIHNDPVPCYFIHVIGVNPDKPSNLVFFNTYINLQRNPHHFEMCSTSRGHLVVTMTSSQNSRTVVHSRPFGSPGRWWEPWHQSLYQFGHRCLLPCLQYTPWPGHFLGISTRSQGPKNEMCWRCWKCEKDIPHINNMLIINIYIYSMYIYIYICVHVCVCIGW